MANTKRSMVIVGRNIRRTPALIRAAAMAGKSGDPILLALFEYDHVMARAARQGADLDAYLQGRRRKLEELASSLRRDGLNIDTRLFWGHPILAHMLIAIVREQPRMVFKDAAVDAVHGHLQITPLELDLLRQCPAPLMLARETAQPLPGYVAAAVDPLDEHDRPRELKNRVMETAKWVAAQCDAVLDVVHAFAFEPSSAQWDVLTGWSTENSARVELHALHQAALQNLGATFKIPPARLQLLEGAPVPTIAKFAAAQQYDLVVMGTVQRNFFQRLGLGSVAEGLLRRLNCDILAVKPDGFREQLQQELEKVDFALDWRIVGRAT